jgi:hypothetical protein
MGTASVCVMCIIFVFVMLSRFIAHASVTCVKEERIINGNFESEKFF